jgi:hypothetical protein
VGTSSYPHELSELSEHEHLDVVSQDDIAHIPMQQYHVDYYRHRGLRRCYGICHVCIP